MPILTISIPENIDLYLENYVKNGWAISKDEIMKDALNRYIDSHRDDIIKDQLEKDLRWGLGK